jgi:2-dehydro-3-deoxyphosphogluconate aldolase / (4S)-4-hydroxy-2-oxoglutarate aldolase
VTDPRLAPIVSQRVIPVVVIDDPDTVEPLGEALGAAGATVVEITFRSAAAPDAIAKLASTNSFLVGAGTVVRAEQVDVARDCGASFIVSPGLDLDVVARCSELGLPVIPGCSTATEIMRALRAGLTQVKLFPAEACGGVALLRALQGPFPEVSFVPTGGLTAANALDYLRLPCVAAVGGSWMVAPALLAAGDYRQIKDLTVAALAAAEAA